MNSPEGKQKLLTIKFDKAPAAPQAGSCAKCKDAGSDEACSCPAESSGKRKRFALLRPSTEPSK